MCYCDICQKNSLSALVNRTRKVEVWGEEITVMYRTEVCGLCGSERYNEKVELAILKKAVALYREKKQSASSICSSQLPKTTDSQNKRSIA